MKKLFVLAIAMASLSVMATAQAAGPAGGLKGGQQDGGKGMRRGGQLGIVQAALQKLDLTTEQKAKLKKIADDFREESKKYRDEMKKLREGGQTPANQEARKAFGKKARARMEELMKSINGILTPEQRTKFAALVKEAREKMMQGRGEKGKGKKNGGSGV